MKTLRYREVNNVKPGILDKEGKVLTVYKKNKKLTTLTRQRK